VLAPFRDVLEERRSTGAAVGAFTCYDVTTALAVVRAAEARGAPVILLVSESSFRGREGTLLVAALLAVAAEARVRACVQLDHATDPALVEAALAARVGAVLADGSRLGFSENLDLVRSVQARAAPLGIGVEAELGHVGGGEDVAAAAAAGALTDPDEAAELVTATNIDCLAVSIGNVHGEYASPPRLDWARLTRIRERVGGVPLSLHGASGLADKDVRKAISLGVSKVNVNTELRRRYFAELEAGLPDARRGLRLLDLERAVVSSVAAAVDSKLDLLEA
jgi:tagatose 1,6-diphosphate aldolase GatY/KbaY